MKTPDSTPEGSSAREPMLDALAWVRTAQAQGELVRAVEMKVRRRRVRRLAVSSGIAAAVLIAAIVHLGSAPKRRTIVPPATPVAATIAVAAPRTKVLPDGSVAQLRDGAVITVEYTPTVRRVLLSQGEVHFQVQKAERPFVVEARGVAVRAVGTAFSVQLEDDGVDVLVTQGRVEIRADTPGASAPEASQADAPEPQPTFVDAGRRCIVKRDAAPHVAPISPSHLSERLSWRIPQLEFSHTPLPDVVALMNQHASGERRLELADQPELREIRLSGYLRADNLDGLARLLETNFGIQVTNTPTAIHLERRPPPAGR